MFDVLSVSETRLAEQRAKEEYGLNEDILIENAAAALYETVLLKTEPRDEVAVLAGKGTNGADGLSLARKLFLAGRKVTVFIVGNKADNVKCNQYCQSRLIACTKLGVKIIQLTEAAEFVPESFALVVDALLGTGLNKPLIGLTAELVNRLNQANIFTLAVDIPTGLNADNGEVMGEAVIADETVTFSAVKLGHLLGEGRNYTGSLAVANIGIPVEGKVKVCESRDLNLPARKIVSHKYTYGCVKIIGGSPEFVGAPMLACASAEAALKCGAGLATLCVPSSLRLAYQQRVKESTLCFLPDSEGYLVFDKAALLALTEKTGAIAIGMGMGNNPNLPEILRYLAAEFTGTLVIDADGLNALSKDISILDGHKAKIVLTPHMGEFSRLAEGNVHTALVPLTMQVFELAQKLNCVIACKSATTVISDGDKIFLNATGTPAMAKGGSGDVLAGMLAAFSLRLSPLQATLTACYHFGKCGEAAEKALGSESVLASDLVNAISLL